MMDGEEEELTIKREKFGWYIFMCVQVLLYYKVITIGKERRDSW